MNIDKEAGLWKEVPGYDNYMVSSRGRVKSLNYARSGNERLLKQSLSSAGYPKVDLRKEGRAKTMSIHKLVAMAFLNHTQCGYKIVVDHIDENKANNNLSNLRLVTNRENLSRRKCGSSKYVGVSWFNRDSKWVAGIKINGKRKHIGYFTNEIDASNAYQEALKNL
mgnify:CR=1 FL=1|tara:strand:+ start:621 stop:1118 length:498 start_codon:yes stop_codon:yes gene_type:complete